MCRHIFEIFLEAIRELHPVARRSPILGVLAIIEMIMKLHEIAHLLIHATYLAIVGGGEFGFEILRRQIVHGASAPRDQT